MKLGLHRPTGVLSPRGLAFPDRPESESLFGHLAKSFSHWDEDFAKLRGESPCELLAAGRREGAFLRKCLMRAGHHAPTLDRNRDHPGGSGWRSAANISFLDSRWLGRRSESPTRHVGNPQFNRDLRVLLIGVPQDTFAWNVETEVTAIAAAYGRPASPPRATALLGSDATFQAVVIHMDGGDYDIVHFAGYAWYDRREGYLMVHDRAVIRANELRSFLGGRPPALSHWCLTRLFTAFVPSGVRDVDSQPLHEPS